MSNTANQNRNAAVAENIKAMRTLAMDIAKRADEAAQCMQEGNRNGAIGTLSMVENAASMIAPLHQTIMGLHTLPLDGSDF